MSDSLTIALDGMGGDAGPDMVLGGIEIAHERYPNVHFLLYGAEAELSSLLQKRKSLTNCVEIRATDSVIPPEMKPSQALRQGRDSSMGQAITAVKNGAAQVAVSAGNTGALMALAIFILRTMQGIDRPALISLMPTERGESAMLDLGANVECSDENLVQFAVMGAAYARTVLNLAQPKVGLINVGTEELKGSDAVKQAADQLRDTSLPMDFIGFVEGDDINAGTADVFVTDGFTGNVALKTAEGTAKLVGELMRHAFRNSIWSRLGYLLARGGLKQLRAHLDPNSHNGGVMLGLNGLVVKSHGSANDRGFASAISLAVDMAKDDLTGRIAHDLASFGGEVSTEQAVNA